MGEEDTIGSSDWKLKKTGRMKKIDRDDWGMPKSDRHGNFADHSPLFSQPPHSMMPPP
jgi:hypothetical protein